MYTKVSQERLIENLNIIQKRTHDSWMKMLESLSKLNEIECYKEVSLYAKEVLIKERNKLN